MSVTQRLFLPLCASLLRRIPTGLRGKGRVGRALLRPFHRMQDVRVTSRYAQQLLLPNIQEPVGFHLMADGVYEAEIVEFAVGYLRQGSVFIDVGANIGAITLPVGQHVGPTGKVFALEPSPRVFPYLQTNVSINNLHHVVAQQVALYDVDGVTLPFYEAPADHFGMGSLAPQFDAAPCDVTAMTLDRFVAQTLPRRVDLIKVDVEGYEAHVFRGGQRLLAGDDAPAILFEFCDWAELRAGSQAGEAQQVLADLGYKIWRLQDFRQGRGPLPTVVEQGFESLLAIKQRHDPDPERADHER